MIKKALTLLMLLFFAALLLAHTEIALSAAREGLALCLQSVIPSLFPMMVVTALLLRLGAAAWLQPLFAPLMMPLFRLRGACALPVLVGLVGGYPVGAAAVGELYRQGGCTKGEAERLLTFCNNCGPAFLLSYVGAGRFASPLVGCRLYLIHVAAALISGFLLCRWETGTFERIPLPPAKRSQSGVSVLQAFPQAVISAFQSILHICAFVTLFTVIAALLPAGVPPAATGLLEMTTGLSRLENTRMHRAMAAALVGFGGISVHGQTMSVLADTGLSLRRHFWGKLLQGVLSAGVAYLLL